MKCRHCKVKTANRPRGLCWTCYHLPGVREKHGQHLRFPGDFNGGYGLAESETETLPGSEEKLVEFQRRMEKRVSLFHPRDNKG